MDVATGLASVINIDAAGQMFFINDAGASIDLAQDVVADGLGNVYVADLDLGTVEKIDPTGDVTTYGGGASTTPTPSPATGRATSTSRTPRTTRSRK